MKPWQRVAMGPLLGGVTALLCWAIDLVMATGRPDFLLMYFVGLVVSGAALSAVISLPDSNDARSALRDEELANMRKVVEALECDLAAAHGQLAGIRPNVVHSNHAKGIVVVNPSEICLARPGWTCLCARCSRRSSSQGWPLSAMHPAASWQASTFNPRR